MVSFLYQNRIQTVISHEPYDVKWLNASMSYDLGFTRPVLQFEKKWGSAENGSSSFWMVQAGTSTPVAGGLWMVSGSYFKNQSRRKADA